jgi:hypothetical protein
MMRLDKFDPKTEFLCFIFHVLVILLPYLQAGMESCELLKS